MEAEIQQRLESLEGSLRTAVRKISELEGELGAHYGLDYGATLIDANSPHRNLSLETAEFGGGATVIWNNGILSRRKRGQYAVENIAAEYGAVPAGNEDMDFNSDGNIDILDLSASAAHYPPDGAGWIWIDRNEAFDPDTLPQGPPTTQSWLYGWAAKVPNGNLPYSAVFEHGSTTPNYSALIQTHASEHLTETPLADHRVRGAWWMEGASLTQLTADADDYEVGAGIRSVARISSDAARSITGIAVPRTTPVTANPAEWFLYLINEGDYNITLSNNDSGSDAANRFAFDADIILKPNQGCLLFCGITSNVASGWRAIAAPAGGGSLGIVADPKDWQYAWGHDFRFNAGNADIITTAAAANPSGLSGWGWTTTALGVTEGSAGDFLSSSDLDPTRIVWNAAADALVSPRIFGSYDHMLIAAETLGSTPTKLCCEVFARWTTNSTNETTSFFGFAAPGTTDAAAAGGAAGVTSNGTNFLLTSDNGSDSGAAVDTSWHRWRIEVGASTTEWFIDSTSQGTITTETDIWPTAFKAITNTNRFDVAWFRVYYE